MVEQRVYQISGIDHIEQMEMIKSQVSRNKALDANQFLFLNDRVRICSEDIAVILPVIRKILSDISSAIIIEPVWGNVSGLLDMNSLDSDALFLQECGHVFENDEVYFARQHTND